MSLEPKFVSLEPAGCNQVGNLSVTVRQIIHIKAPPHDVRLGSNFTSSLLLPMFPHFSGSHESYNAMLRAGAFAGFWGFLCAASSSWLSFSFLHVRPGHQCVMGAELQQYLTHCPVFDFGSEQRPFSMHLLLVAATFKKNMTVRSHCDFCWRKFVFLRQLIKLLL